jgi:hypothetical protein
MRPVSRVGRATARFFAFFPPRSDRRNPYLRSSVSGPNGPRMRWALASAFSAAFDLSQRNTQSALTYPSVSDTTTASVGREMSETGAQITRRNLNVQPTVNVPVGYKFTVRVNRDILFDALYEPLQANPLPVPPPGQLHKRTGFSATGYTPK